MQYYSYFSLETFKSYSEIKDVYYDTTRDFVLFLTMITILCVEKFLAMNPFKYIKLSLLLLNILLLLSLISTNIYY